jgi:hypothetical protein
VTISESERIDLPAQANHCRHANELVRLVARPHAQGWVVCGYYGCIICGAVELARPSARPSVASMGGGRDVVVYGASV